MPRRLRSPITRWILPSAAILALASGGGCLDPQPGAVGQADASDISDASEPDATAPDVSPPDGDVDVPEEADSRPEPTGCDAGVLFSPGIIHAGQTVTLCAPGLSEDATVTFDAYTEGRPDVTGGALIPTDVAGTFEVVVDAPEPDASHTFYRVVVTTAEGTKTSEAWLEVRPAGVPVESRVSFVDEPFEFTPSDAFPGMTPVTLMGSGFDLGELHVALVHHDTGEVVEQPDATALDDHHVELVVHGVPPDGETTAFYRIRVTLGVDVAMSRVWLEVYAPPTP